jgi:hypothetical protein
MSMHLYVRSRPAGIMAAWLKAGWSGGAIMGAIFGLVIGCLTAYESLSLPAVPFALLATLVGSLIGVFVGLFAGLVNAIALNLLARPLVLRPASRLARLRAAAVVTVATEAALLPVQCLFRMVPLEGLLLPTIPSLFVAAVLATRLPPAGCVAGAPDALVQIQTECSESP